MQIEEELSGLSPEKDTLLTIGVFDGVHLGHKYLISKLIEQAREQNLLPGVVTFRQHPQEVVAPQTKLPFLTEIAERIDLLRNEGVEIIIPISFTADIARVSARQFVSLLQKHLRMRGLVIGPDFALGRHREGDADALRQLGQDMKFSVTIVPPEKINGEVVSSTAIRRAIADGDMRKVDKLVGRPFRLHGHVVTGAGRGVGLGFPTANLDIKTEQAIPADGVYASWAHLDGKAYQAMTNIGKCPTFDGCDRTVEAYIVDYHGNLYGQELKVDIMERLRDEKKFSTVEELKRQMAEDVKQGKAILNAGGGNQS
ncbi:bifunctional riboflavin kinase/FAD synthetase [Chloroflexota bacterium]